jgi:protein-disulfide isomerase
MMRVRFLLAAMAAVSLGWGAEQRLVEGNPDSAVRVIVFEDLQCPDCAIFRQMLDEKLLPKYAAKVAFEHRDFPLARHAWARKAAIAARFFEETGAELAVRYRRETLRSIGETTPENFSQRLAAFAKVNGIDPQRALAALGDAQLASAVERDFQDGVARGVAHTPTVFVDGAPFVETFTFEELAKAIDAALAQAAQ